MRDTDICACEHVRQLSLSSYGRKKPGDIIRACSRWLGIIVRGLTEQFTIDCNSHKNKMYTLSSKTLA